MKLCIAVLAAGLACAARVEAASLPLIPDSDCAAEASAIDDKFKFKTHWGTFRIVDADPDKLCHANKKAAYDKRVGANSVDESSICRSTYIRLKNSIQDYKAKVLSACEKGKSLADLCTAAGSDSDPKAAFRCVSENAKAAAAAERLAVAAMQRAAALAEELKKSADRARTSYVKDYEAIAAAYRTIDTEIANEDALAKITGNYSRLTELLALRQEATGVKDGRLARGVMILDQTALTSQNGGESTITGYRQQLERNTDFNSPYGLLVNEQDWARDTAASFRQTADSEIRERTAAATRLAQYATQNESLMGPAAKGPTGNPSAAPTNGLGSTLTGLAGAAAAAGPLATMLQKQQAASSPGSTTEQTGYPQPGTENPTVPGERPELGTSVLGDGEKPAGDKGVPFKPVSPGDIAKKGPLGPDGDRGEVSGGGPRLRDELYGASGGVEKSGVAGAAKAELGVSKAGAGEGGERKTASTGDGQNPEAEAKDCKDKDCGALASLQTNQFAPGGAALGVPQMGVADPAFSPLGALENLFGALPGDPNAKKGSTSLGGLEPAQDYEFREERSVQAAPQILPDANSESLFRRVHSTHVKALKKGIVSLFHVQL